MKWSTISGSITKTYNRVLDIRIYNMKKIINLTSIAKISKVCIYYSISQ